MKRGDTVKITATIEQLQQMGIDIDITREGEFMETYSDRWSKVKIITDGVTHFWDIRDIYLEKKEEETVEEKDNSKGEVKRYFEKDLEEAWNASDRNMHNTFSSSAYKQITFKEWLAKYKKAVE